jgi:hypothetical protein
MSIQSKPVLLKQLVPTKVEFTNIDTNPRTTNPIGFCSYDDQQLKIQTGWIEMDNYGIPRYNEKFYSDVNDVKRALLKIPENESSAQLFAKMKELDDHMVSVNVQQQLFSKDGTKEDALKIAKKYVYKSVVREPSEEQDEDGNIRPNFMKVKFKTALKTNDIETKIYKVETDSKFEFVKNENGIVKDILNIKTLEDLEEHKMIYRAKVRFHLHLSKTWTTNNNGKSYGLTWKIIKMDIAPAPRVQSSSNDEDFIDSDDDDVKVTKGVEVSDSDDEPVKESKKSKAHSVKEQAKTSAKDSDDSDSDDEPAEKSKKTKAPHVKEKTKATIKGSDDSDESDEPDPDSDSDSDSDAKPQVKVAVKKPISKSKKASA